MFDLIITAGTAVLPSGTEPADLGISGGKLAAVGGPGSLAPIGATGHRCRRADRNANCDCFTDTIAV
jgi:hypothetical protein